MKSLNVWISRPKRDGESNLGQVKTIPSQGNLPPEGLRAKQPFHRAGRLPLPVACQLLVVIKKASKHDRLTVGTQCEVKPFIRYNGRPTATAASCWRLITVTPWIEWRRVLNTFCGLFLPCERAQVSLSDYYCSQRSQKPNGLGSLGLRWVEVIICSVAD